MEGTDTLLAMTDVDPLIVELEPFAATFVDRHFKAAKEWFPHEYVPWSRGRDFEPGEAFDPNHYPMPDGVRSALLVNLLTEDNLPHYHFTIASKFGAADAWGEWSRRWTAEEGRHSIVIRDYLLVTRAVDPIVLERGRMAQIEGGEVPDPPSPVEALAYVAMQELATRISHRNTGKLLEDPRGFEVMARVAQDENLHHIFYRDLVTQALEIDPSRTMIAIDARVRDFAMPGVGIANFDEHAKAIAREGIYDFKVHHDQILEPILMKHWRIREVEGLDAEGEAARDRVISYVERLGKAARRLEERRAREAEKAEA